MPLMLEPKWLRTLVRLYIVKLIIRELPDWLIVFDISDDGNGEIDD